MATTDVPPAGYERKEPSYFGLAREDIASLVPSSIGRVLDIGCGAGMTLKWLRSIRNVEFAAGVELVTGPAEQAKTVCDEIVIGNIETITLPFTSGSFDLILALDVLEHLVDPWFVVRRLHGLLSPGGSLIASIPNIAHYSVSLPLLRGHFRYEKWGILDATHLRFFVKDSAEELLTCSGMVIDINKPVIKVPWDLYRIIGWRRNLRLQALVGRLFPHLFTYQFIMRARNVGHCSSVAAD